MSKATDDYSAHSKEVEALQVELNKAYEYARGLESNTTTIKMWDLLMDPEHHLLGGFLKEWKETGNFSEAFVQKKKVQIAKAFDQIIQLESARVEPQADDIQPDTTSS
jgi:hypothetical protein